MSVQFVSGTLFDSDLKTLVNPVNCIGISGAGLAKRFKKLYPKMHAGYVKACKSGECAIGRPWIWTVPRLRWVLCFPTKRHWHDPSELASLDAGLARFVEMHRQIEIESAAFPALGCGYGGLAWEDVRTLMLEHLEPLDIPVEIYLPQGRT